MTIGDDTKPLQLRIACEDSQLDRAFEVDTWAQVHRAICAAFVDASYQPLAVYVLFAEGDSADTRNPFPGWEWWMDGVNSHFLKLWSWDIFQAQAEDPEKLALYCSAFSTSDAFSLDALP